MRIKPMKQTSNSSVPFSAVLSGINLFRLGAMRALILLLAVLWTSSVLAGTLDPESVSGASVRYKPASELKLFPVPAVGFERPALVSNEEHLRIQREVLVPLAIHSKKSIAAFVVEFKKNIRWRFFLAIIWTEGGMFSTVGPENDTEVPLAAWVSHLQYEIDNPPGD